MISDFFTKTFTVKRASWLTDEYDNQYSEEVEVGSFLGHLQQANAQLAQTLGLNFTKTFTIWCPSDTDIREGDTVTSELISYSVRAIQVNNIGDNKHIELTVELDDVTEGS